MDTDDDRQEEGLRQVIGATERWSAGKASLRLSSSNLWLSVVFNCM